MDKIFTNNTPEYEILNFQKQGVGLYHNVSKFLGEELFYDIQDENKMKWIEDPAKKSNTEFFGEIVDRDVRNKTLGLIIDILPSKRIFQKEMQYYLELDQNSNEIVTYANKKMVGPKFVKVLPSEQIHNYELNMSLFEETYFSIYYFNDNYEGGEIFLPEKNEFIYPKKNDLVFFPANYSNYVISPITKGTQYVLVIGTKTR
jgi:hypothetical protein